MKTALLIFFTIMLILIMTGCADQITVLPDSHVLVGFWYGLWHGMIAPFAFIGHLFDESIGVYAKYNNGGWYDFGFLLGVGAFAGGASKSTDSN